MGNRALSAALRHIAVGAPELLTTNYFKHALLMAADDDDNALGEPNKLEPLLTLADNINVDTNEHDLAMFLSSIANSLVVPLGWYGPAEFGTLPGKVIMIDCTDVGDTHEDDGSTDWGHQYFRNSRPVTVDVRQVLQGILRGGSYLHTAAICIICAETHPGATKRATLVLACRT